MGFSLISAAEIVYHCFVGFFKGKCSLSSAVEAVASASRPRGCCSWQRESDDTDCEHNSHNEYYDGPNTTDDAASDEDEFEDEYRSYSQVLYRERLHFFAKP